MYYISMDAKPTLEELSELAEMLRDWTRNVPGRVIFVMQSEQEYSPYEVGQAMERAGLPVNASFGLAGL